MRLATKVNKNRVASKMLDLQGLEQYMRHATEVTGNTAVTSVFYEPFDV